MRDLKLSRLLLPADGRIDPSSHSISLADIRRPDAPLVYVNRGFQALTGYTPDDCIGRNCRFLQGPDTDKAATIRMREAIATGEPLLLDILNYRKDGRPFWNRVSLRPIKDDDSKVTHVIGIQTDITRLLALEGKLAEWASELVKGRRQDDD